MWWTRSVGRNDHTKVTAPLPVCSAKLSTVGPGYYGGGPCWNPWCCSFVFFASAGWLSQHVDPIFLDGWTQWLVEVSEAVYICTIQRYFCTVRWYFWRVQPRLDARRVWQGGDSQIHHWIWQICRFAISSVRKNSNQNRYRRIRISTMILDHTDRNERYFPSNANLVRRSLVQDMDSFWH
jgi:hypothetical protein